MVKRIQCTVVHSVPLRNSPIRVRPEPKDSSSNRSVTAICAIDTAPKERGYRIIADKLNENGESAEDGPRDRVGPYGRRGHIACGLVIDMLA